MCAKESSFQLFTNFFLNCGESIVGYAICVPDFLNVLINSKIKR